MNKFTFKERISCSIFDILFDIRYSIFVIRYSLFDIRYSLGNPLVKDTSVYHRKNKTTKP